MQSRALITFFGEQISAIGIAGFFTSAFASLKLGLLDTFLIGVIRVQHVNDLFEFDGLFGNHRS